MDGLALKTNNSLQQWSIKGSLGKGGFGEVYRAVSVENNSSIEAALKVERIYKKLDDKSNVLLIRKGEYVDYDGDKSACNSSSDSEQFDRKRRRNSTVLLMDTAIQRLTAKLNLKQTEYRNIRKNSLQYETLFYHLLKDTPLYVPKMLDYGFSSKIFGSNMLQDDVQTLIPQETPYIIVLERLGPTLKDLSRISPSNRIPLKTIIYLMPTLLDILHSIHKEGIIYRDVKSDQFCYGKHGEIDSDNSRLFIIDFGLARFDYDSYKNCEAGLYDRKKIVDNIPINSFIKSRYEFDKSSKLQKPVNRFKHTGTAKYASLSVHNGYKHQFSDDLESFAYMILDLLYDRLPWSDISGADSKLVWKKTRTIKQVFNCLEFMKDLPIEFIYLIYYARGLSRTTFPDYIGLKSRFENLKRLYFPDNETPYLIWGVPLTSFNESSWVDESHDKPESIENKNLKLINQYLNEMSNLKDIDESNTDVESRLFIEATMFFEKYKTINEIVEFSNDCKFDCSKMKFKEDNYLSLEDNKYFNELILNPDSENLKSVKALVRKQKVDSNTTSHIGDFAGLGYENAWDSGGKQTGWDFKDGDLTTEWGNNNNAQSIWDNNEENPKSWWGNEGTSTNWNFNDKNERVNNVNARRGRGKSRGGYRYNKHKEPSREG